MLNIYINYVYINMQPITDFISPIMTAIKSHDIIAIISPGGTGKTTQIPLAIYEYRRTKVIVSVSSTEAAKIFNNTRPKMIDQTTQMNIEPVSYMTSEELKNYLLTHPKLINTDIVIDDISSNSVTNYIIYTLWKELAPEKSKLILMGALIDKRQFPDAHQVRLSIDNYPISVRYHHKNYDPGDSQLLLDTAAVIRELYQTTTGNILVYIPSSIDSDVLLSQLNLPVSIINKEIGPNRTVLIATSEYEVAAKNVEVVVDTMITRQSIITLSGAKKFRLNYITQDSAIIRSSQASRYKIGICYRMCTLDFFNLLPVQRIPEIYRSPLFHDVYDLLIHNFDPKILKQRKVNNVLSDIRRFNLLNTEQGKFVLNLPYTSLRCAMILWQWLQKQLPIFPCLCAIALIDSYGPEYYWYPPRKEEQTASDYRLLLAEHRNIFYQRFLGQNDLETMLNWWNDLLSATGTLDAPVIEVVRWARNNSMIPEQILEVRDTIAYLIAQLNRKVIIGPFTSSTTVETLKPILADIYRDKVLKLDPLGHLYQSVNGVKYNLSALRNVSQLIGKENPYIIGLITSSVVVDVTYIHDIDIGIDISESDLIEPFKTNSRAIESKPTETECQDVHILYPYQLEFEQIVSRIDRKIIEEIQIASANLGITGNI